MEREPVAHSAEEYRLARLPSGTDVTATVHTYDGGPGPTVYVQAAQHGIELNGPAAVQRLHERLLAAELAGTVVAVPVANPLAFDNRSYMAPASLDALTPNLNRAWPGDETGTLQERMAARLWNLAASADAVVDVHTGSPDTLPHVRFGPEADGAERVAAAFGSEFLLADRADGSWEGGSGGKLRAAAARAGIPAIAPELADSRGVDESAVRAGADGLLAVLRELGVLAGAPDADGRPRVLEETGRPVFADESGLFEPDPDLAVGDHVSPGDELGTVSAPGTFERLETVTADRDGVLYSLRRGSVAVAGERLAGVATERGA